jgi:hypothetical protein
MLQQKHLIRDKHRYAICNETGNDAEAFVSAYTATFVFCSRAVGFPD